MNNSNRLNWRQYLILTLDLIVEVDLRLIPRKSDSVEGKRPVETMPVKLAKSQTEAHKSHVDS